MPPKAARSAGDRSAEAAVIAARSHAQAVETANRNTPASVRYGPPCPQRVFAAARFSPPGAGDPEQPGVGGAEEDRDRQAEAEHYAGELPGHGGHDGRRKVGQPVRDQVLRAHAALDESEGIDRGWAAKARALRTRLVPPDLDPDPLATVERLVAAQKAADGKKRRKG